MNNSLYEPLNTTIPGLPLFLLVVVADMLGCVFMLLSSLNLTGSIDSWNNNSSSLFFRLMLFDIVTETFVFFPIKVMNDNPTVVAAAAEVVVILANTVVKIRIVRL